MSLIQLNFKWFGLPPWILRPSYTTMLIDHSFFKKYCHVVNVLFIHSYNQPHRLRQLFSNFPLHAIGGWIVSYMVGVWIVSNSKTRLRCTTITMFTTDHERSLYGMVFDFSHIFIHYSVMNFRYSVFVPYLSNYSEYTTLIHLFSYLFCCQKDLLI